MNNFRFYKNELPLIGDLVMGKVKQVNDVNAYVDLLEYNIRGSILLSELSRKSRINVKKMIYEGKEDIYEVIKLDSSKKHIDLSKKNINTQEIEEFKAKYSKYRALFNIMMKCSIEYHLDLDMLYREIIWILDDPNFIYNLNNNELKESDPNDTILKLDNKSKNKSNLGLGSENGSESETGSENESESQSLCYDKFVEIANGNSKILNQINLSDNIRDGLYKLISNALKKKKMKIQSNIHVQCYSEYGIIGIKNSLLETKKYCLEKYPNVELNIKLLASPEYSIYIVSTDIDNATMIINEMILFLENHITTTYKGRCDVDQYPQVVENQKK